MRAKLVAAAVLLLSSTAIGQQSVPDGWGALVQAINAASPFNPNPLQNREFVLNVSGAKSKDTLIMSPAEAFQVTRQSDNKFLVKIVDPEVLVRPGSVKKFKDVGFTISQSGINDFGAAIEGRAACTYDLSFRQTGANADFDLPALESEYDVTFEESGTGRLATRSKTASGLSVTRLPGDQAKVDVRMILKAKIGQETLTSNWVSVPSCGGQPSNDTPRVAQTQSAGSCMQKRTVEMSSCVTNCGTLTLKLKQRFENVCSGTRVRCEGMQWQSVAGGNVYGASAKDYWVQLDGGEITDFDVSLPAPLGTFDIKGPNLNAQCRYL